MSGRHTLPNLPWFSHITTFLKNNNHWNTTRIDLVGSKLVILVGKLKIFEDMLITVLNKELVLNSEMIITLIVASTIVFVLLIGLLDKLFSSKRYEKTIEKEK